MNSVIPHLNIKALSSAIGATKINNDEFLIHEGVIPPPKWYTPVRQDYYPFLCLEDGLIRNIVDLQHCEVRKNDLFFLRPSQIVQVESISPNTKGKMIAFEKSFMAGERGLFLEKLGFLSPMGSSVISLREEEARNILDCISEIRRRLEDNNHPHRRLIALNLMSSLLLEIDAIHKLRHLRIDRAPSRKQRLTNQFHNLLSLHFLHERTVKFYADLLNITPKYLTELTKQYAGKTAGELIDDRVVLEAKVLLRNPEMSIKRVAAILHFSDQFFFSKYFKNFTGFSPSQYRNADS